MVRLDKQGKPVIKLSETLLSLGGKNYIRLVLKSLQVRRATKFMSDLGAHPEAGETRKADAYAAPMIAGGLLHAFTRPASS
jgi:hypothetical protein